MTVLALKSCEESLFKENEMVSSATPPTLFSYSCTKRNLNNWGKNKWAKIGRKEKILLRCGVPWDLWILNPSYTTQQPHPRYWFSFSFFGRSLNASGKEELLSRFLYHIASTKIIKIVRNFVKIGLDSILRFQNSIQNRQINSFVIHQTTSSFHSKYFTNFTLPKVDWHKYSYLSYQTNQEAMILHHELITSLQTFGQIDWLIFWWQYNRLNTDRATMDKEHEVNNLLQVVCQLL